MTVPPTIADQLARCLFPVSVAVLLWLVLFAQQVFRGRVSVRSLLVLTAMIAVAVAAVGAPPTVSE